MRGSCSPGCRASITVGAPTATTGTPRVSAEKGSPAVAHAGAGDNACVCHLNHLAKPVRAASRQGVHHHDPVRPRSFHHTLDNFRASHAGSPQNAWHQGAHRAYSRKNLGQLLPQVPGHQDAASAEGPHRVRSHSPVSQAHHQNAFPAPQVQKVPHSLSQGPLPPQA